MAYLIIPRLEVKRCNVLSSWLISPTSIVALYGFTHNMQLQTGVNISGMSVVHHDYRYDCVGKSFSKPRAAGLINKKDYAGDNAKVMSVSLQPWAKGDITISLILEITNIPDLYKINNFLRMGRIAGGEIRSYLPIKYEIDSNNIRTHIRSGFVIKDRRDLIVNNPFDDMIQHMHNCDGEKSWLSLSTVGYVGITNPINKDGIRDGHDSHMYVESLIGMIEYVSIRKEPELLFKMWESSWINPKTFICKQ